ncbi:hypothetical protein [Coxiella endosymbiont of Ornithodoros maritimus]|uniref:hypothetical protein n=1 Tax=Coxiella endosymbiont of Ornithodoros maritimus TaxID=1656172 RepID=UPI002263C1DB|nr:hypothetical protein [Coxiella endosymbiont of Ornithodoros maritimus]
MYLSKNPHKKCFEPRQKTVAIEMDLCAQIIEAVSVLKQQGGQQNSRSSELYSVFYKYVDELGGKPKTYRAQALVPFFL